MGTKIALTGTRGGIENVAFMTGDEATKSVGQNCGNLVFQYAASKLIDEDVSVVGIDISYSPNEIREKCRVIVVPSANFIREGWDCTPFVNLLEKSDLPLVFLGLGAQAEDFGAVKFDFHPSVLRLISLIKERCDRVAVRGAFTERVLSDHGVTDLLVTGCPSNLIAPDEQFITSITSKLSTPPLTFLAQAGELWPKNVLKKEVDQRLYQWCHESYGVLVQQAVPEFIKCLRAANIYSRSDAPEDFLEAVRRTMLPNTGVEEFLVFMTTKVRNYFSVDQWLEDTSKFDISLGLRLHGNMVALQSGTPALWITHDARTRELVETMALPSIDLETFLHRCSTPQDVSSYLKCNFDVDSYRNRRRLQASRYEEMFKSAGIPMRKSGQDCRE